MGPGEELLQRLDVLESEAAIRQLMAEYVDARDGDLLITCFTPMGSPNWHTLSAQTGYKSLDSL